MVRIEEIAPLQLIVLGFEQPKFDGRILDELNKVRESGTLRIVDALAVYKDSDGTIESLEVSDLPKSEAMKYGAVIGYLFGLGSGDQAIAKETARKAAERVENEYDYGMQLEDIQSIAHDIPVEGGALIMLVEHRWALPLKRAVRDKGGILIAQDFLSPEALLALGRAKYAAA